MSATTKLLILLAALSLTACNTTGGVKVPEVRYVEVEKPIKRTKEIDKLLEACPIEMPNNWSIEELWRVAKARADQLKACNIDKAALSKSFE